MSDHTPAPIEAFWAGYRQQLGEPTDVEVVDFTTPDMKCCLGQVTVPTWPGSLCSKPKRTWG